MPRSNPSITTYIISPKAMITAQIIKVPVEYVRTRRWQWGWLLTTGGMPSSHMTLVSCFAALMGLQQGWTSPPFQCALVLALIVMSDAWGARRAAGRQASVLNRIVSDFYRGSRAQPRHLRELIGHTPLEVLAGAVLGVTVAVLFWK